MMVGSIFWMASLPVILCGSTLTLSIHFAIADDNRLLSVRKGTSYLASNLILRLDFQISLDLYHQSVELLLY